MSIRLRFSGKRSSGLTLVELLIVLVVVGVLAALALPSFNESVRKSRRGEAVAAVVGVQQAQERWRGNNPAYATSITAAANANPPGLGLASVTPGGYYDLTMPAADATGYVITAAGKSGTSQADDPQCSLMAVRMEAGTVTYAGCGKCAGFSATDFAPTHVCWAQ